MLKNYFKIAFRNLLRNKAFSFINITGLAVGMASAMLILLWIQNEISHDRFYKNADRIYTLNNRDKFNGELWAWNTTPKILVPTIKQEYPEVEQAVRVTNCSFLFTVGDKHINESGNFTDTSFFKVFSFPLLEGNASTALNQQNNIVITQKLAKKLFGNTDAVGKIIRIDSADNFTVTAVMKDLPNNTSFDFDYLLPWSYLKKIGGDDSYWGNNSVQSYLLLKPGVSLTAFNNKIKNVTINHTKGSGDSSTTQVFAYPLKDMWLYSKSDNGQYVDGRIETVNLFAIIACFILLIACINFMNLSTARSEKRAKEVGIRKVVGAQKSLLIAQFIGESILLAFIAFVFALIIVAISLPGFNNLVGKQLHIDFANGYYWLFALAFIIFSGVLAGSYPAFYLSSYKPVKVLKGTFKASHALVTPRKILVVLQFTFAIALIICTILVEQQIKYAQDRDTGYAGNLLVYTNLNGDINKNFLLIKNELINSGAAVAVTKSMSPVTQRYSDGWGFTWTGSNEDDSKTDFVRMSSDADFVKTLGVHLLQGRDIDIYKYPTDSTAVLLNEAAVKVMRLKNPVGTVIHSDDKNWTVVGVVKDFIYGSPYDKVQQLIVMGPASWFGVMHFKLNPANSTQKDLNFAQNIFKTYNPQYPFDYKFADESYALKFQEQQRTGTLAALFAGLTIFISCLGLFGLATYMAENRIKEIGVRKVLGASVINITTLLSKDFLKLVIISLIVASPIAWWAMSSWLKEYTYRINIEWWVFVLAGFLSIAIALLTISYQSIKAAIANPAKSLRSE
ncbi:MAG: ABC transporter permease [Parafilimonas sp.]